MLSYNLLIILNLSLINASYDWLRLFEKSSADKQNSLNVLKDNVLKHFGKSNVSDVEAIRSSNWYFERFIQEYNYDEKKAEKAIIEGFDFFHREGFHQMTDTYFPSEAYAVGGMYRFGLSKFGQPLVGVLMNHIRPFGPKLSKGPILKLTEKYCLYNIYKTLFEAKEKNFVVYVIFTNTSMESTEYSLFQKTMTSLNKYFPGVPTKLYSIGMNKVMEMSVKLLVQLMKPSLRQRMSFIKEIDQMDDMISLDEIPVHAGGRNKNFQRIPPGVKSGKCLSQFSDISPKDWDLYREINNGAIHEGMRESDQSSLDQYLRSCDRV